MVHEVFFTVLHSAHPLTSTAAPSPHHLHHPCTTPQPKLPAQFNFPHFYILGYQKCATTSLFQ